MEVREGVALNRSFSFAALICLLRLKAARSRTEDGIPRSRKARDLGHPAASQYYPLTCDGRWLHLCSGVEFAAKERHHEFPILPLAVCFGATHYSVRRMGTA